VSVCTKFMNKCYNLVHNISTQVLRKMFPKIKNEKGIWKKIVAYSFWPFFATRRLLKVPCNMPLCVFRFFHLTIALKPPLYPLVMALLTLIINLNHMQPVATQYCVPSSSKGTCWYRHVCSQTLHHWMRQSCYQKKDLIVNLVVE
jgi:hypothetical protein